MYSTTYKVSDINRELDKNRETKIGCILIDCGVNNIEENNGREVAEDLINTVDRIRKEHPLTKIVLGEITPYHERDTEVNVCNAILRERVSGENIYMVRMDFLRDASWSNFSEDRKHIKAKSVALFAGSYIAALRRAYNLPPKNERRNRPLVRGSIGANPVKYQVPPRSIQQPFQQQQQRTNSYYEANAFPAPLMQNIVPKPREQSRTETKNNIGERLRGIANSSSEIDPKQNLISKLSDMLDCVKAW